MKKSRKSPDGKLHVGMVSYSFYESDNRVMRYAEALAKRGDSVDVFSLRREHLPNFEVLRGVRVHRIQERQHNEKKKIDYGLKMSRFLLRSAYFLSKEHLRNPYEVIHVHSVPDFEVFAALLPKLRGAKIILDIHDIVPEFYASKFNGGKSESPLFCALKIIEKISALFSDHVIVSNHIWAEKLITRSVGRDKCTVILNYPDPSIFSIRTRTRNEDKFIMMYPGSLNTHQGLDIAIKAFSIIKDKVPESQFQIYGSGSELENLRKLVHIAGLSDSVLLREPVDINKISGIMASADLGVVPKRNDGFGGEAFSTKILEFMSLGVPVLVSATKIDKYYFNDSVVKFFEPESVNSLSESMLEMIRSKSLRETLAANGLKFVEDYSWEKKKSEYLDLVDRLVGSK